MAEAAAPGGGGGGAGEASSAAAEAEARTATAADTASATALPTTASRLPTAAPQPPPPPPAGAGGGGGGGGGGSNGGWTKQVACRYFMHGVCKEGDNCRYSHDLFTSQSAMVCRYFQRGCCAYGDRCRYEHTKPLKREEVSTVSPAAKTYPSASTDVTPSSAALEVSTGETEIEDRDLIGVGAGAEDWVNAVEFVPGQPYCGR
ncbi:hypothetical protein JRQ81_015278, partial [Phrynocephalus forsythii]